MDEHPESPRVDPKLPPTAKQEDAMWNALCDSTEKVVAPPKVGDTVTDGQITGVVTETIQEWFGAEVGVGQDPTGYVVKCTEACAYEDVQNGGKVVLLANFSEGDKAIRRAGSLKVVS